MSLRLYSYFRSSAAFRVRIALNLKGIQHELIPVNIFPGKDEQLGKAFLQRNPEGRVPFLEDGAVAISQSMAMLEYLEEAYKAKPLLPKDTAGRARVRSIANLIACDIHPLNNLSILRYLKVEMEAEQRAVDAWYKHWVTRGLGVLEAQLSTAEETDTFCHGNQPSLSDVCLVPQLWNARRLKISLDAYPTLERIEAAMMALESVQAAAPEAQADAQ